MGKEETHLEIVIRDEGGIVPEGVSITDTRSYRVHIAYQKTLPNEEILRFKLAIPHETFLEDIKKRDFSKWAVYETIQKGD